MNQLDKNSSSQAVLKLANEIARLQEARDLARQLDHDILIEIKTTLQYLRENQDRHNQIQSSFEIRLKDIESIQHEQKGAWKAALAAGSVGGALAGLLPNFLKN